MLEWTGERYLPWLRGVGADIHYEHLQRYALALPFVKGKRVLDLGSGEGYGAFLLAQAAAQVTGVDIDPASVKHATNRYGPLRGNLTFLEGPATAIPVPNGEPFDAIICFETLEHIADQHGLFAEIKRLLKADGVLVISTPNREVYSDREGYRNEFHLKELYFDEFERLLLDNFRHAAILGQRVFTGSFTWGLKGYHGGHGEEVVVARTAEGYRNADRDRKEPRYFIGVASDDQLPSPLASDNRLLDVSNGYLEEFLESQVNPRIQVLHDEAAALRPQIELAQNEAARLASLISTQESDLARQRIDLHRLQTDLGLKHTDLTTMSQVVAVQARELERRRAKIEHLRAELEKPQQAANAPAGVWHPQPEHVPQELPELTRLQRELANARLAVAAIYRSRSWRSTAPFRALRRVVKPPVPPLRVQIDTSSFEGDSASRAIAISGWALGPRPCERIDVLCDGKSACAAEIGLPRPDVDAAFPHLREAGRSGFSATFATTGLLPGPHLITVRAVDAVGQTADASSTVTVESTLRVSLDDPSPGSNVACGDVLIRGWALGFGPVLRVDILCDGALLGTTTVGLPRPDVATSLPHLEGAARSGFSWRWDASQVVPGLHTLAVRAVDSRETMEVARDIQIEAPLYVSIDEPPLDCRLAWGNIVIRGWAAGPSPVVQVEVLCDDEQLGVTTADAPRPDVAAARPTLMNTERSGFVLPVELKHLVPGTHELVVQAVDARHQVAKATRRIVIESPVSLSAERADVRRPFRPLNARSTCQRFALYTASLGNYFFGEIASLLAAGLAELGFDVEMRDERNGFADAADWHVVVAPHEFFYLGAGPDLLQQGVPERLILLNTEQPSTQWFSRAFACFSKAHAVWDINFECSRVVVNRGIPCSYLALGYTAGFEAATLVDDLPEHYGTYSLEPEVRARSSAGAPFARRPIDVLFVGHMSSRRETFFARAASTLSRYRCYLHLSSADAPVIPGRTTHMDTPTVLGLAQRSKILLNIHHGGDRYFEWHRMVIEGIWQRALVVTEPCGIAPPFRSGIDYVEAPLDEIAATIDYYLSTAEGRKRAEEIIEHAFSTLTRQCRLAESLRPLILELHDIPKFPLAFSAAVEGKPGVPSVTGALGHVPQQRILPRLSVEETARAKIALIAGIGRAASIRDFGGLWGVLGRYLLEGAKALGCEYAQMVDVTPIEEFWDKVRELHANNGRTRVEMLQADFRDPALYETLSSAEVSLLYEVLLHQDNAEEVIKRVLSRTTQFVCLAQPVLNEKMIGLPGGTVCLQFYNEELKDLLRCDWWTKEPPVQSFDPRYWMWGQTVSYFTSVFRGYGWALDHLTVHKMSEQWNYALMRFAPTNRQPTQTVDSQLDLDAIHL